MFIDDSNLSNRERKEVNNLSNALTRYVEDLPINEKQSTLVTIKKFGKEQYLTSQDRTNLQNLFKNYTQWVNSLDNKKVGRMGIKGFILSAILLPFISVSAIALIVPFVIFYNNLITNKKEEAIKNIGEENRYTIEAAFKRKRLNKNLSIYESFKAFINLFFNFLKFKGRRPMSILSSSADFDSTLNSSKLQDLEDKKSLFKIKRTAICNYLKDKSIKSLCDFDYEQGLYKLIIKQSLLFKNLKSVIKDLDLITRGIGKTKIKITGTNDGLLVLIKIVDWEGIE